MFLHPALWGEMLSEEHIYPFLSVFCVEVSPEAGVSALGLGLRAWPCWLLGVEKAGADGIEKTFPSLFSVA